MLSFDLEGHAIPAAHLTDAWEKDRAKYSIERYNLDFPPLMDRRKVFWSECNARIQEYLHELSLYHADKSNVVAKEASKQALNRLRELMGEEKELSAVVRACLLSRDDPRLKALLQSA